MELSSDVVMDSAVHQLNKDSTKIWLSALDIDVSDPEDHLVSKGILLASCRLNKSINL